MARLGRAREAQLGKARHGKAGEAGEVRLGRARHDLVRLGGAVLGAAGTAKGQGRATEAA
jgi:hypothetical protein